MCEPEQLFLQAAPVPFKVATNTSLLPWRIMAATLLWGCRHEVDWVPAKYIITSLGGKYALRNA